MPKKIMIVLTFNQLPRKSDHLIYSSNVNPKGVQPQEVPGFEDFSSKPPKQLLRRSTRVVGAGSTPPPREERATQLYEQPNQPFQIPNSQPSQADNVYSVSHNLVFRRTDLYSATLEELKDYMKCYVDNKIGALEALIKENHSELMKAVGAKDNKSEKHVGGISMPHIVDDSIEKGNVDPQPTSDQFFQQPISPIQMNYATVDHDSDVPALEVEKQYDTDEKVAKVPVIDALVYGLPNQPINVKPLSVIILLQITGSDDFLSDSQLPTQLPVKEPAHNNAFKDYAISLTSFRSSDKDKDKIDGDIHPYTPFDDCRITYQLSSLLMQEFFEWIQKGLLKSHAKK
ncbi:hypothetical protein R3W88_004500 [Solanum pinnatisectum]|uniref:Uncharacterized protein n=1 Tax=Solanum pinnatisectum TaxID=50273 RepID=A0AAV9K9K0_9SOLN|nr:hypothetical protein R3W88_004500 [Solanum pinnatisectum]